MSPPKKFKTSHVARLYKDSYRQAFDWASLLPPKIYRYLDILEKSKGCPLTLSIGALLPLTATLCGTKCSITTKPGAFSSPLNTYSLCICDPGGGKSATYDYVISPVVDRMLSEHGLRIVLEQYTTAGIQRHQHDNKGYGLISTEEGSRFFAHVNAKQIRNEGERAILCKMWGGKGDLSILSDQERGFKTTSMSMAMFIQPDPLIHEMMQMGSNDGFLDRFLFFVARPRMNSSKVVNEHTHLLKQYQDGLLPFVFDKIFKIHSENSRAYYFDNDAQQSYDKLVDAFADNFNRQYNSASGELQFYKIQTRGGKNIQLTCMYEKKTV